MKGCRIRVRGRVQGVFFRNWAVAEAESLALRGWVRNRTDGSVELLVFGEAGAIEAIIASCHRGPPAGRVEEVEVEPAEGEPPHGFGRQATL
jgi:acylphosphatase